MIITPHQRTRPATYWRNPAQSVRGRPVLRRWPPRCSDRRCQALARDFDCFGNLHWVVIHQYYIRSFNGSVRTHSAHSNTDVCPAKHRGIVDAISHKSQFFFLRLVLNQLLHFLHLVGRKQFTVNLIQPQCGATLSATFLASPVSITVLRTPADFNAWIAPLEWGFTMSEITMCPAYFPSIAM